MLNFDAQQNAYRLRQGTETQVGSLVKPYAERFFSTTAGSIKKKRSLRPGSRLPAGIRRFLCGLGGVQPDPELSLIHQGIELCRQEGIGFILAVGGGVIDSAKGHRHGRAL